MNPLAYFFHLTERRGAALAPNRRGLLVAVALLAALVAGCTGQREDPQTLALREQVLLAEEPSDAVTLTQLAQRLDERAEDAPADAVDPVAEPAVIVGRIFAGDLQPWENGKAAFLLAELPEEGHGEGHDADNCPFCRRKAAMAPTAMVQFLDSQGQVIQRDARQLFGLATKDVVTIRGQATRGELNTLIVDAQGIHVHRR